MPQNEFHSEVSSKENYYTDYLHELFFNITRARTDLLVVSTQHSPGSLVASRKELYISFSLLFGLTRFDSRVSRNCTDLIKEINGLLAGEIKNYVELIRISDQYMKFLFESNILHIPAIGKKN